MKQDFVIKADSAVWSMWGGRIDYCPPLTGPYDFVYGTHLLDADAEMSDGCGYGGDSECFEYAAMSSLPLDVAQDRLGFLELAMSMTEVR